MRDLLSDYDRLSRSGRPVGRAVVTSVWGSAPRPEGSSMLATADGTMAGSVSGGCVEGATATEIGEAIGRGTPKLVTFGVTHERAWEVGLACGGTIKVFVEPRSAAGGPGRGTGSRRRSRRHHARRPPPRRDPPDLRGRPDGRHSRRRGSRDSGARRRARGAPPRGQRHRLRRQRGWSGERVPRGLPPPAPARDLRRGAHRRGTRPARPRTRLPHHRGRRPPGVPHARAVSRGRPADPRLAETAFEQIGLDASCYVCILSHDPKFDEPALQLALRSPARYIGAIGSRKTQGSRREWLRSRDSPTRRSPACTDRSGWTWAAASPPRRRWRSWRK